MYGRVTRWARYRLHEVIQIAGHNAVYWDTDSVKYLGNIDVTRYNDERIKDSTKSGAFATDRNGKIHYMGVFEDEGYKTPNRFKTMGAKKYVLEDSNGKLHITIAGVNKKEGGKELKKLSNFKEGFTFKKAGGTESVYNDNVHFTYAKDGHLLESTDNVVIRDSTYKLGLTADYLRILNRVWKLSYLENEVYGLYHKVIKGD